MFDTWESVGEHYAHHKNVLIAEIDCEESKDLCHRCKVKKYPTLIFYRNSLKFEKYIGERTKEDFISYIDNVINGDSIVNNEIWSDNSWVLVIVK